MSKTSVLARASGRPSTGACTKPEPEPAVNNTAFVELVQGYVAAIDPHGNDVRWAVIRRTPLSRVCLCAAVVLSCATAALAQPSGPAAASAVTVTDANLRIRPERDAEIIGVVRAGTPLQVVEADGDWSEVNVGGYTGFVYTRLLSAVSTGGAMQGNSGGIPPALVAFTVLAAIVVVVVAIVVAVVRHPPGDHPKVTPDAPNNPPSSGTTAFDIKGTCMSCDEDFWWTAEDQASFARGGAPDPSRCPACREATEPPRSQELSAQHATDTVRSESLLSRMLTPAPGAVLDHRTAFSDINAMLAQGMKPVDTPPVGSWEGFWAGGVENVWKERRQHNEQVIGQANSMIVQRRDLFRNAHEMLMAAASVQQADIDMQSHALQSHLRLTKLQEELREQQALAGLRLETKRLQELAAQARAKADIHPRDRHDGVVDDQRRARRAHVRAEEERIAEFVDEVTRICEDGRVDGARAVLIRRILTLYQLGEEALPAEVRALLQLSEEEA